MGSITEFKLGSTKSITKAFDAKGNGKKLVKIVRDSDGKILTFSTTTTGGHAYSVSQIIHQFELARHFHGTNGNGNVDAHVNTPFGTINPTQTTGLSNGDIIQLRIGYTGGNSGPATVPYTIPAGTFKPARSTVNSFTGFFHISVNNEVPRGTAAEKEAEFMRIVELVKSWEFKGQTRIGGISLPDVKYINSEAFQSVTSSDPISLPKVEYIRYAAFEKIMITSLSLPSAKTIEGNAFYHAPLTSLSIPNALTIGHDAFHSIVNAPTTQVTMPAKFNTKAQKDSIFGSGHWDKITFNWV